MSHTKDFVHTWSDGVNRGGTANFVFEYWSKFFAAGTDGLTFFAIWVPGVFFFGAGFLTEGGEGNLREAILDDFVAFFELVFFPVAELLGGLLNGVGDFLDLCVCERVVVNVCPIVARLWGVFGGDADGNRA